LKGLLISSDDLDLFKLLKAQPSKISEGIKAFKKRRKGGNSDVEDEEE
jgi:hypothetical protein